MTTVVLLVLAIVWAAVLFSWLRSRAQSTFSDSVGTFRRHLTILERTMPATVPAANRRRGGPTPGRALSSVGLSSRAPSTRPAASRAAAPRAAAPRAAAPRAAVSGPAARRRQTQKRRRDVFTTLVVATVGTLLIAAVTASKEAIIVQVLCDLSLGAYVSLLVHQRNLAGEREFKLSYLDAADGAGARRRPVAQRPVAQRPSRPVARPARARYEVAAGYGEMALRRAAN